MNREDLFNSISECLGNDSGHLRNRWRRLLSVGPSDNQFFQTVRSELTGNDCLLIRSAQMAWQRGKSRSVEKLTGLLDEFVKMYEKRFHSLLLEQLGSRIQIIRMVVEAESISSLQYDENTASKADGQLEAVLSTAMTTTCDAWNWNEEPRTIQQLTSDFSATTNSGDRRLQAFFPPKCAVPERWRKVFQKVSESKRDTQRWMNPGLQMAADTIASVLGAERQPDATVRTSILFAIKAMERGLVVHLTMERLPDGCGLLIPAAAHCSFVTMDKEFSTGLQNAWYAVRAMYPGPLGFDWRWSLDLKMPATVNGFLDAKRLLQIPLSGRSPEAAIACAMLALHPLHPGNIDMDRQNPLDPNSAITATIDFDRPWQQQTKIGTSHPIDFFLGGVESLGLKTRFLNPLERYIIHDVVIAEKHPPGDVPDEEEKGFRFPKACTLQDAFEKLGRWQKITRVIKKGIFQEACRLLVERQHSLIFSERTDDPADIPPYVRSPLRQMFPELPLRPSKEKQDQREVPYHQLSKQELIEFELGCWIPRNSPDMELPQTTNTETENDSVGNSDATDDTITVSDSVTDSAQHEASNGARIWLHADSGMGKSMLLIACEKAIAGAPDGRIPLRIGKGRLTKQENRSSQPSLSLSSVEWTALTDSLKTQFINLLLAKYYPTESCGAGKEELQNTLLEWFSRAVYCRNTVFLLDALDQTLDGTDHKLSAFLNDLYVQKCLVILAGRPEAADNRGEALAISGSASRPIEVELCEFDAAEQAEYLGKQVAAELMTKLTEPAHNSSADDLRRLMWKPLLGVPLLISLMRTMGTSTDPSVRRLRDISSRFELYQHAVRCLLMKGCSTSERLKAIGIENLMAQINEVLGDIAIAAAFAHNFTGQLTGDVYQKVEQQRDGLLLSMKELFQLDLVTSLMDAGGRDSVGLEWRHRSLMEYFAGVYLTLTRLNPKTPLWDKTKVACVSNEDRRRILREIHETPVIAESRDGEHRPESEKKPPTIVDRVSDWHWTLRFALCHAAKSDQHEALAIELLQHGNPWVVYETIDRDGLKYSESLEILVKWLVHRHWTFERDFGSALQRKGQTEVTKASAAESLTELCKTHPKMVEDLLNPATRDASYLDPLLELLSVIQDKQRWADDQCFHPAKVESRLALPPVYLYEEHTDADRVKTKLKEFVDGFVKLPDGVLSPLLYYRDVEELKYDGLQTKIENGKEVAVPIPMCGLRMSSFFVTKELFELFDSSARRSRGRYSWHPDHPAVDVSWHMARAFTEWLTHMLSSEPGYSGIFRLPKRWELELAVRWWREDPKINAVWVSKSSKGPDFHTRSRKASKGTRGWISSWANVWSWTGNSDIWSGRGHSVRGFSLRGDQEDTDAFRIFGTPGKRRYSVGFRVVWLFESSSQSSIGFCK